MANRASSALMPGNSASNSPIDGLSRASLLLNTVFPFVRNSKTGAMKIIALAT